MKSLYLVLISLLFYIPAFAKTPAGIPEDINAYKTQAERYSRAYHLFMNGYAGNAFPLYKALAEEDYVAAQYDLGVCYLNGYGTQKNEGKALKWFRKAAEMQFAKAQEQVGIMYLSGVGTHKNYKEAVKWLRKAAEQGNASAQFHLGSCYEKGTGVTKNEMFAIFWYKRALNGGDMNARNALIRIDREQRSYRSL